MLACILGRPGEVFFPKLGEDQMLTFSSICDDFVKAEGFTKKEYSSDADAKAYAAEMSSRVQSRDPDDRGTAVRPCVVPLPTGCLESASLPST